MPVLGGAPPVPGIPVEFLLGDEFGGGPALVGRAVCGERARGAARGRHHIQIVAAHERDEAPFRTDLRVDLVFGGVGQPADLRRCSLKQPDVALDRDDDEAALVVPRIVDNAARLDALPLAAAFFGLRQFAPFGNEGAPIDQQARRSALHVCRPQVGHTLIVGLRLEIGDNRAVRRQLHSARPRTGQIGVGKHAFGSQTVGALARVLCVDGRRDQSGGHQQMLVVRQCYSPRGCPAMVRARTPGVKRPARSDRYDRREIAGTVPSERHRPLDPECARRVEVAVVADHPGIRA